MGWKILARMLMLRKAFGGTEANREFLVKWLNAIGVIIKKRMGVDIKDSVVGILKLLFLSLLRHNNRWYHI